MIFLCRYQGHHHRGPAAGVCASKSMRGKRRLKEKQETGDRHKHGRTGSTRGPSRRSETIGRAVVLWWKTYQKLGHIYRAAGGATLKYPWIGLQTSPACDTGKEAYLMSRRLPCLPLTGWSCKALLFLLLILLLLPPLLRFCTCLCFPFCCFRFRC